MHDEPLRFEQLAATLAALGAGSHVVDRKPVGGGAVGRVYRIETDEGSAFALKCGSDRRVFEAEARGLESLRDAGSTRTPEVFGTGSEPEADRAWLLLEWIEPGRGTPKSGRRLGRELRALHNVEGSVFGGSEDNYIGPLLQANDPHEDWGAFWWTRRIEPQLESARRAHPATLSVDDRWRELRDALMNAAFAPSVATPRLLHGDLWSGNVLIDRQGAPVLIDPAVYWGDPEVDLAMMEIFGGFDSEVLVTYRNDPSSATIRESGRIALYSLYPLLVHVNLFGRSYLGRALYALSDALDWLSRV